MIDRIETLLRIGREFGNFEPSERRKWSERFVVGSAGKRRDGPAFIAHGREQFSTEQTCIDRSKRIHERRERSFRSLFGQRIDPCDTRRDLGMSRCSFQREQITLTRFVEISCHSRIVCIHRNVGLFDRAKSFRRQRSRCSRHGYLERQTIRIGFDTIPSSSLDRRGTSSRGW